MTCLSKDSVIVQLEDNDQLLPPPLLPEHIGLRIKEWEGLFLLLYLLIHWWNFYFLSQQPQALLVWNYFFLMEECYFPATQHWFHSIKRWDFHLPFCALYDADPTQRKRGYWRWSLHCNACQGYSFQLQDNKTWGSNVNQGNCS